jgi:intracellular sulfur oxidation DsrE/DsrF family protein
VSLRLSLGLISNLPYLIILCFNQPMKNTVLLITNEGMGKSERELQFKLIAKYFQLLLEYRDLPNAICFYTEGVRLVVEGSPVLDSLRALEEKGVRLIVCSTCLGYFGLMDKVQVGIVGGMGDILEAQVKAEKVITL